MLRDSDRHHYARLEVLFHAAIENGPKTLESFLATACEGDEDLRAAVADLVDRYECWSASLPAPAVEHLPRFGPYECEAVLGSGGMGTVYRAHRADGQFSQQVAIKVLRGSLKSDWYRQRFLMEREILALLDHPNIARLLDGGMTDDGEPYLAMELVDGEAIDRYSNRQRLSVADRIALFRQVLDAVDYAHRHLIVHRDLKPSNILVTAAGQVKLLDFGTSKLLEEESTATGHRALTPRYASPEQLRGEQVAIATDVFSAGVVLYELLTGAGPFGNDDSMVASLERAVGNVDPLAPVLSVTEDSALLRSTNPKSLRNALAGDLSSVLLKPLADMAADRYPTAAAFRDDLDLYRAGRPVSAKAPTIWYLARKFTLRHRMAMSAAALAMVLFTGAGLFSWREARAAQQEAARAETISGFLINMLNSPNPSWANTLRAKGKGVTVLDVLNELRGRIGQELGSQPAVEIELRRTIGAMYTNLGQNQQALEQLHIALQGQLALTGRNHPDTGVAYVALAAANYNSSHVAEALDDARAAVEILSRTGRKRDREAMMEAYDVLSLCLTATWGPPAEIESAIRKSIALSRELHGDGGSTPILVSSLATVLQNQGRLDEAADVDKEALALFRKRPGGAGFESFGVLRDLGVQSVLRGNYREGKQYLRESLDLVVSTLGANSSFGIEARANFAFAEGLDGEPAKAERDLETCIRDLNELGGSNPLLLAAIEGYLGRAQVLEGHLEPAEANLRKALSAARPLGSKATARIARAAGNLGECLLLENKREEALPLLTESYQSLLAAFGPNHIWTKQAKQRVDRAHE